MIIARACALRGAGRQYTSISIWTEGAWLGTLATAMDESRVIEIEVELAHQQERWEQMNDALVRQQRTIDELAKEVERLKELIGAIVRNEGGDEGPPPHY